MLNIIIIIIIMVVLYYYCPTKTSKTIILAVYSYVAGSYRDLVLLPETWWSSD
jgi:hypothetical protein